MFSSQEQFAIGIDIGATKIASVLISEAGAVARSLTGTDPCRRGYAGGVR